mmetsp:Transcript_8744/g.16087  ORF Transcript_8744/g.16087 Transcript_8744/m.16087 type:complete len:206 (+) Transcript_8744:693-1310(+)
MVREEEVVGKGEDLRLQSESYPNPNSSLTGGTQGKGMSCLDTGRMGWDRPCCACLCGANAAVKDQPERRSYCHLWHCRRNQSSPSPSVPRAKPLSRSSSPWGGTSISMAWRLPSPGNRTARSTPRYTTKPWDSFSRVWPQRSTWATSRKSRKAARRPGKGSSQRRRSRRSGADRSQIMSGRPPERPPERLAFRRTGPLLPTFLLR